MSCDLFIIVYHTTIRNNLVQLFNSPAILRKYFEPEISLDLVQLFNSPAILQKYLKPEISLDYNVMSPAQTHSHTHKYPDRNMTSRNANLMAKLKPAKCSDTCFSLDVHKVQVEMHLFKR